METLPAGVVTLASKCTRSNRITPSSVNPAQLRCGSGSLKISPATIRQPSGSPEVPKNPPFVAASAPVRRAISLVRIRRMRCPSPDAGRMRRPARGSTISAAVRNGPGSASKSGTVWMTQVGNPSAASCSFASMASTTVPKLPTRIL